MGLQYEYNLIPGMTIKSGEKIAFRTMKYNTKTPPNKVTLTLPSTGGNKTIELLPGENGPELTTPRRLNYITTYAGGSATQSGVNPDIDELFTDSQNITGRTRYVGAKIKLFYPDNTDYEFTIADQKTRTKMNVNGAEENGYTFTTEGKDGFTMPAGLVKDSVIGITNTDVKKASTPSEKAAGEKGYTPNGFKVDKYIDHNGDELKGDALALRKFITDEPKKANTQLLGWTTKKLEGTPEEVKKAFDKLEKATTADKVNGEGNSIFTETSPITKETTVYAAYGPVESAVYNPEQKYDDASDKQYIEATPADENKKAGDGATYKLVKKTGEDGEGNPVYEELDVPVTKIGDKDVFDITGENSPVKHGDKIFIKTEEKGKPASYSTTPVVVDKQAPEFVGDISVEQDAYNYKAKISATAKDKNNILKIYVKDSQNKGYYDAESKLSEASMQPQIELHQGQENKEFTVIAVDKFGNKNVKQVKLQNTFKPIKLEGQSPYVGDNYIYVKSEQGAVLSIKVQDDFGEETFLEMTHTANGEFEKIELKDGYKIKDFDMVVINAKKGGSKATNLNLYAQ